MVFQTNALSSSPPVTARAPSGLRPTLNTDPIRHYHTGTFLANWQHTVKETFLYHKEETYRMSRKIGVELSKFGGWRNQWCAAKFYSTNI